MKTTKIISLLMVLMLCLSVVMPCMSAYADGEKTEACKIVDKKVSVKSIEKIDVNIEKNMSIKAVTSSGTFNGFNYNIIDNSYAEITGYIGTETEAVIPAEISGYAVKSIGFYAFKACGYLISIKVPDSVTFIGLEAFANCESLTSINVSENNAHYSDVDGVLLDKDKTALLQYPIGKTDSIYTIPSSVKNICDWAFAHCISLTSIDIPSSVTWISEGAFAGCKSLTSIEIPNSVTGIGEAAFQNCTSLVSIKIPNSVTYIDYLVFYKCENLTIYGISGSYAESYANKNGIPFVVGNAPSVTPSPSVSVLMPNPESGYTIDSENGTLSGVDEKTSMEALVSKLENGESIVVTKVNGEVVNDSEALVGTGYIVKLLDKNGSVKDSVVVVVIGDTTGDAIANSRDIAAMQKHVIETKKLEGAFLLASDMKADGTLNSRDIAQLQKKLVG